jgi:hypothetical protein
MPRSSITGSHRSSISSFLRNLHTVFHSGCINLHSHQQCIRVPVLPHPHQYSFLLLPLILAILTGVRWNLSVVLIYISFITKEIEHFFMYLLAICTSLRIHCLIHVPISSLGCWFFGACETPYFCNASSLVHFAIVIYGLSFSFCFFFYGISFIESETMLSWLTVLYVYRWLIKYLLCKWFFFLSGKVDYQVVC